MYGYNLPESDYDLRGFCKVPQEYLYELPGKQFRSYQDKESDTVVYNVKDYLWLTAKGNMSLLEILFAPKTHVTTMDNVGQLILDNRHIFLTKNYYRVVQGFALSEWRKARAVELEINREDKRVKLLEDMCSAYNLKAAQRNDIVDVINEAGGNCSFAVERNSSHKIDSRRKEEYQKFGYCAKNASNVIRLLSQGIELLKDGIITFPRPEADLLKQIRAGKLTINEIEQHYNHLENELEKAYAVSPLPKTYNNDDIERMFFKIYG